MNDDIGLRAAAVFGVETDLCIVFDTLGESRALENARENYLAPIALRLVVALKRLNQIRRLDTEFVIELL